MILLATATIYITGCTQPKASEMLKNDTQKNEIYSAILSNDQLSSELMDSLMMKHHDQIMLKMNSVMMGDKDMQMGMMDNMMSMCKNDSSMCKMMMGTTMDMCDADQSKCNMMMNTAQSRPNVKKAMDAMCNMKSMNTTTTKDEPAQHH